MHRASRLRAWLTTAALLAPLALAAPAAAGHVSARGTGAACPVDQVSSSAESGYGDVDGHLFAVEISCLSDYEVARGRAPGRYDPGAPVLRQQMALFLWRTAQKAGLALEDQDAGFTDLAALDEGTRTAVNAVAGLSIASGVGNGRFAPGDPVTRGQMATFLDRFHEAVSGARFAVGADAFDGDEGTTHEASANAVAHAGVGVGVTDRDFAADRPVTRGQMAGFLARVLDIEVSAGRVRSAYEAPSEPPPSEPAPSQPPPSEPPPSEPPPSEPGPAPVEHVASTGLECTVVGTDGDDVLTGTDDDDVLCGLAGDDVLTGGDGGDVLDGGPGSDELDGQEGDDDLDGGAEPDVLDGGLGTNWCVPAADDVLHSCVYDQQVPTVESVTVTPESVDVDAGDVPVVVVAHVLDDTGVREVDLSTSDWEGDAVGPQLGRARLVAGTVRDGYWEAVGTAVRYATPGLFAVSVNPTDRVGRWGSASWPNALEVRSSTPDSELPQVSSASLTSSTGSFPVDVGSQSASVTVEVGVTDDLSGVEQSLACLYAPSSGDRHSGPCVGLDRVSGSPQDGVYRATMPLEAGALSGDWDVMLSIDDRAHVGRGLSWTSPEFYDEYAAEHGLPASYRRLPDGVGRFPVVGAEGDATTPTITDVVITPSDVDTLYAPQDVTVRVRAVDPASDGVRTVSGQLTSADGDGSKPNWWLGTRSAPDEGTAQDGWWTFSVTLPQGTPPDTYHLWVFVADGQTSVDYADAGTDAVKYGWVHELPVRATVTVVRHGEPA